MEKFKEYLKKVGITSDVLLERVRFLYDVATKMCPEKIEKLFVDDYITKDKTRAYESIWFFSQGFILEAHNFETDYEIDIVPTKGFRLAMELKDYNFNEATEDSRLRVFMTFAEDISGELKATKENCDVLRDIVLKYIKPKLVT